MNKRRGVVIAILLLLLFGTGTFVFANPSEEESVPEETGNRPTIKRSEANEDEAKPNTSLDDEPVMMEPDDNNVGVEPGTSVNNNNNNQGNRNQVSNRGNASTSSNAGRNNNGNVNNQNSNSNNQNSNTSLNGGSTSGGENNNSGNESNTGGNGNLGDNTSNAGNDNQGGNNQGEGNPDDNEDNKPNNPPENKDDLINNEINNKLEDIKNDLTQEKLDEVKDLIDEIKDENLKQELTEKLNLRQELLDLTKLVDEVATRLSSADSKAVIDEIRNFVQNNDIYNRLETLLNKCTDNSLIDKLSGIVAKMNENDKILKDIDAPKVLGINNGDVVNAFNIYYDSTENSDDIKVYIGSKLISLESINNLKTEGTYAIDFVDKAFNKTTICFTIDSTLPIINGVKSTYNQEELEAGVKLEINDASDTTIYIEKDGTVSSIALKELMLNKSYMDGDYKIWAVDKAGNKSNEFSFQIDTVAPLLEGIESKTYNLVDLENGVNISIRDIHASTIYIEHGDEVTRVEASSLNIDKLYSDGEYKVWAIDDAGNKSDVLSFWIDKSAPIYQNLGIVNLSRLNTSSNIKEASLGDELEVFVTFNEELGILPIIKVNDNETHVSLEKITDDGLYVYVGKYVVSENDIGEVRINVTGYSDNALNKGIDLDNSNINHEYSGITIVDNKDEPDDGEAGFEFVNGKTFRDGHMVIKEEGYAAMDVYDRASGEILGVTPDKKHTTEEKEYTMVRDGSYTFILYDEAGNEIKRVMMIFDSSKPVISGVGYNDGNTTYLMSGGIHEKVDLKVEDAQIDVVTRIHDDGTEEIIRKYKKYDLDKNLFSKTFDEEGHYNIVVIDKAGNASSIEFDIKKNNSLLSRIMSIIGVRI